MGDGTIATMPLTEIVSAVSVGIIGGEPRLDLEYVEDSRADVDMNLVVTESGRLVEVQASAEGATYTRGELDQMMDLALAGCRELADLQRAACEA